MSRRKIYAWLWAFGLLVGANAMTALASEQKAQDAAAGNEIKAERETEEEGCVSRIVSFTDCTGMHVTYDANASRQYVYEVKNGVLTDVKVKKSGEDGAVVLEPNRFEGTVELQQPEEGEKYTSIAADLFGGNTHITYVKLPAGIHVIAAESFQGCTALKSVYLPSTVTSIEEGAFRDCTAMTRLAVPKSVTAIGDNAFQGDTRLQTLYFKEGDELASIGSDAFPGADEAKELVIVAGKGSMAETYAEENGIPFEEE